MKSIKKIALLLAVTLFVISVNAQTARTKSQEPVKSSTQSKTESNVSEGKETRNSDSPTGKTVSKKSNMQSAGSTAGTNDAVVNSKKGPNGEIVYTGPKGGNYYINKSGNKIYLKQ